MRPHFLLLPLLALSVTWQPCQAEKPLSPIAASLRPFVADQTISGAVALVVNKDQILSLEALGQADLAVKKPMTEDAMFWIAP